MQNQTPVARGCVALAMLAISACAAPAFDFEAWRAGKLAELTPHSLENDQPIAAISVDIGGLGYTLDQRVALLAPGLRDRVVGHSTESDWFSRTTTVRLDERPISIAQGTCRVLTHGYRAYPTGDPHRLTFTRRFEWVGFFAAEKDGSCPYEGGRATISAASDVRAVFLLASARAVERGLADGDLRIRCDQSVPDCTRLIRSAFNVRRITGARSCDVESDCVSFDLPGTGGVAPYGLQVEAIGSDRPRRIIVTAAGPPLLP